MYALSKDATINMNYITIEKWTEPPKMELAYFTDCGDHDPSTLSEGEEFGYGNSVTEQLDVYKRQALRRRQPRCLP